VIISKFLLVACKYSVYCEKKQTKKERHKFSLPLFVIKMLYFPLLY